MTHCFLAIGLKNCSGHLGLIVVPFVFFAVWFLCSFDYIFRPFLSFPIPCLMIGYLKVACFDFLSIHPNNFLMSHSSQKNRWTERSRVRLFLIRERVFEDFAVEGEDSMSLSKSNCPCHSYCFYVNGSLSLQLQSKTVRRLCGWKERKTCHSALAGPAGSAAHSEVRLTLLRSGPEKVQLSAPAFESKSGHLQSFIQSVDISQQKRSFFEDAKTNNLWLLSEDICKKN